MPVERTTTVIRTVRLISLAPVMFFGLGILSFSIVMFIRIAGREHAWNEKMESIQSGKVPPEQLVVYDKYVNHSRHNDYPHIRLRGSHDPKANASVTVDIFNSVKPGDTMTGYYFPDGYFFPESQNAPATMAKWIFLSFGLTMGGGLLVYGLLQTRKTTLGADALESMLSEREEEARKISEGPRRDT